MERAAVYQGSWTKGTSGHETFHPSLPCAPPSRGSWPSLTNLAPHRGPATGAEAGRYLPDSQKYWKHLIAPLLKRNKGWKYLERLEEVFSNSYHIEFAVDRFC